MIPERFKNNGPFAEVVKIWKDEEAQKLILLPKGQLLRNMQKCFYSLAHKHSEVTPARE